MRAATLAVAVVAAVALVEWANWMAQRYVILSDDTARGHVFRDGLHPTGSDRQQQDFVYAQCTAAAEAFYDHVIRANGGGDFAPPNEKAFYTACTGAGLGGHGGGGGPTYD